MLITEREKIYGCLKLILVRNKKKKRPLESLRQKKKQVLVLGGMNVRFTLSFIKLVQNIMVLLWGMHPNRDSAMCKEEKNNSYG